MRLGILQRMATFALSATLALGALGALGALALAGLGRQASAVELIYCYEARRQIVRQTAPHACSGRVVSAAEAEVIRQQRARYVQDAVRSPPPPRPSTLGSGFFVSRQGHVVTNRHVVEQCHEISVLTPEGRTITARLASVSDRYDMALLQTNARPAVTGVIATKPLRVGHPIRITGFPVRKLPRVRPLESEGLYLQTRRLGPDGVLVLAAKVWSGSSGSSVVAADGTIAGLVFARNPGGLAAAADRPPPDRTFAIPAKALHAFLTASGIRIATARAHNVAPERYTVRVNCH